MTGNVAETNVGFRTRFRNNRKNFRRANIYVKQFAVLQEVNVNYGQLTRITLEIYDLGTNNDRRLPFSSVNYERWPTVGVGRSNYARTRVVRSS